MKGGRRLWSPLKVYQSFLILRSVFSPPLPLIFGFGESTICDGYSLLHAKMRVEDLSLMNHKSLYEVEFCLCVVGSFVEGFSSVKCSSFNMFYSLA